MDYIQVDIIIKTVFAISFVIAFIADTSLIFFINCHIHELSSFYYSFHKKIGLVKITILKTAIICWVIYFLIFEPSGKSGSIFTIITAYCIIIIKLFTDYRKTRIKGRFYL